MTCLKAAATRWGGGVDVGERFGGPPGPWVLGASLEDVATAPPRVLHQGARRVTETVAAFVFLLYPYLHLCTADFRLLAPAMVSNGSRVPFFPTQFGPFSPLA